MIHYSENFGSLTLVNIIIPTIKKNAIEIIAVRWLLEI